MRNAQRGWALAALVAVAMGPLQMRAQNAGQPALDRDALKKVQPNIAGQRNGVFIEPDPMGWADHAGFVALFDGKTLNGWDSASAPPGRGRGTPKTKAPAPAPQPGALPAVGSSPRPCSDATAKAALPIGGSRWEVVNGSISPCGDPAGYLTSTASFRDFVLTTDFRTAENTNSGVFVRSPGGTGGYEVQIWKQQPAGYNTGSIVGTAKTAGVFNFKGDVWNHYEITADGDHLIVVLNGVKTLDVHDAKFPEGRVRLQYQKYPIEFRNIKVKPIRH